MDEQPARISPDTDRTAAALVLGCSPNQVGYCTRCHQGLTARYGFNAQVVCPHCQATDPNTAQAGR
ncbi:hypothetical protein ACWD5Q_12485 [Streptomyces sp. NPDC002513]